MQFMQQQWQPIETAPREPLDKYGYGPDMLLWVDSHIGYGYWDRDFDKLYVEFPEAHRGEPTHWMPMPAPPKREMYPAG